jgi:hypothetical protein
MNSIVYLILNFFYFSIQLINCDLNNNWENFINASIAYRETNFFNDQKFFQTFYQKVNVSHQCEQSIFNTLKALKNLEDWSHQMYNSWGRFPPSGIFEGTVTDFGDYDQCLAIKPNEVIGESQYCLIDTSFPLPKMNFHQNFFHKVNVLPQFINKSSNNVFVKFSEDASFFYWFHIRLGICTPTKCTQNEVQAMARNSK